MGSLGERPTLGPDTGPRASLPRLPSLPPISVARALPEPPSSIAMGRRDCELLVTGRTPGEELLPMGRREGDEPDTVARGLWVLPGVEIRRSPLAEAFCPELLGDGWLPRPRGRIA